MNITVNDFMRMQPNYPRVADSDKYYLQLALRLGQVWDDAMVLASVREEVKVDAVLAVVGYYQDIVADSGIWRSFITLHKEWYGRSLPFYDLPDDYCDSELNVQDVQFVLWYVLECNSADYGQLSPHDHELSRLSEQMFAVLDEDYLSAPDAVDYTLAFDVETDNVAQSDRIMELSSWLFWHSFFMHHAATGAKREALIQAKEMMAKLGDKKSIAVRLMELNDRIMLGHTTGPLALTVGEWLMAIVDGKVDMPAIAASAGSQKHMDYSAFIQAIGEESRIAFCDSYDALETFFSDVLGRGEKADGYMPEMRHCNNFVVYADEVEGIVVAKDIAQYVCHPDNGSYNSAAAAAQGYKLLTEPGLCHPKLLRYLFAHLLLPDLRFPYEAVSGMIQGNWDFLARLYLQNFYRDAKGIV